MKAVDKSNIAVVTKFSTLSNLVDSSAITRSISTKRGPLGLQVHMIGNDQQADSYARQNAAGNGSRATAGRIAERIMADARRTRSAKYGRLPIEPIQWKHRFGDDEDSHLGDFIEDTTWICSPPPPNACQF